MSDVPNELKGVEAALGRLAPHAALNRDRLMFEAGRRAARSRGWPAATLAFAGLALVLGVRTTADKPTLSVKEVANTTPVGQKFIYESVTAQPRTPSWGHAFQSNNGYLSQRDRVVNFGAESLEVRGQQLPGRSAPVERPLSRRDLLRSM